MATNDLSELKTKLSNIKGSRENPIYKSNIYWSQKSFNVTDILISSLSEKGDTVFDPFMGSGVTIIESVSDAMARNSIGVDINDVPVFIVETILKSKNISEISKSLKSFLLEANKKCSNFYSTEFDGQPANISLTRFDIVDGKYYPSYVQGKYYVGKKKIKKFSVTSFSKNDVDKLNQHYKLENVKDYVLLEDSKLAAKHGEHISHIFTGRNIKVLDILLGIAKEPEYSQVYETIRYILLSMIHLCKITDTHSNSQWPLWIPNKDCVEKNVLDILSRRINLTEKAFKYVYKNYKKCTERESPDKFLGDCNFTLYKKPIQYIDETDIPNESVDLIITDPPYLGQVAYSEYMQLYEPFLGFGMNYKDEIVVSSAPSRLEKNTRNYFLLLDKAFEICSKKLKNGKVMCLYFHDSKLGVWSKLIALLAKHGFRFITQLHIDKTPTVKNNISKKKSLNGDAILFFEKDKFVSSEKKSTESIDLITRNVVAEARHMLSISNNGLTTPELYDNGLMEYIIHNGWLDDLANHYKSLVEIFEGVFLWDETTGKWMLPSQNFPKKC